MDRSRLRFWRRRAVALLMLFSLIAVAVLVATSNGAESDGTVQPAAQPPSHVSPGPPARRVAAVSPAHSRGAAPSRTSAGSSPNPSVVGLAVVSDISMDSWTTINDFSGNGQADPTTSSGSDVTSTDTTTTTTTADQSTACDPSGDPACSDTSSTTSTSDTSTCDPNYEGACVPMDQGDVNCSDLSATNFRSVGTDPYNLDPDKDGIACES